MNQKRRIAIDVRPLQDASRFRGVGNYLHNLLLKLPDPHSFVLLSEKGGASISEEYGIPILQFEPPFFRVQYAKKLERFLSENKVSLMHFSAQYNIPKGFSFPYTITVHDLFNDYLFVNDYLFRRKRDQMGPSLMAAKGLVAISEYVKESLIEAFPISSSSIDVVYNGYDPFLSENAAKQSESFLTEKGIRSPYILFIGNFEPRKNLARVITAVNRFNAQLSTDSRYQLVACVGLKPLLMPLSVQKALKTGGDDCLFLNYLSHENGLAYLIQQADCLCFPSLAEGFGLPVLESLSLGTPVITSTCTSLPEVGQDAAALVDPFSVEAIEKGLHIVSDPEKRDLLLANRESVLSEFSFEKCSQGMMEFWDKMSLL